MRQEAEANAEADKAEREKVEKLNAADNLIFQTEKQMKEFDEKLSSEDKDELKESLDSLKKAHSSQDLDSIEESTNKLNETWSKISTKLYQEGSNEPTNESDDSGEAEDVSYEEVN